MRAVLPTLQHRPSDRDLSKRQKQSLGPGAFSALQQGGGLPFAASTSFVDGPLSALASLASPHVEKKDPLGLMMRRLEESQEKADIWDDDFDGSLEVEKLNGPSSHTAFLYFFLLS